LINISYQFEVKARNLFCLEEAVHQIFLFFSASLTQLGYNFIWNDKKENY